MNVLFRMAGMATAILLAAIIGGCTWSDPDDERGLTINFNAPCYGWGTYSEPFVHWTPDSAWLVLDEIRLIRRVAADGSGVQTVKNPNPVDPDPSRRPNTVQVSQYGFYADVSPAASRIVYTSCEFPNTGHDERQAALDWRIVLNYELVTIGIDGTDARRLTDTAVLEHFPVWSPDGRRIAFLQSPEETNPYDWENTPWDLSVMNADGTDRRQLAAGLGLFPPVWSPDGSRLAYISEQEATPRALGRVEVVGVDTGKVAQLGVTTAVPAWSPDGTEVALAGEDDEGPVVLAAEAEGTGTRTLLAGEGGPEGALVTQLAWSPTGTGLVIVTDAIRIIRPGAADALQLIKPMGEANGAVVAWTRDGARIAVYDPCRHTYSNYNYKRAREYFESSCNDQVVTVRPDGTDLRFMTTVLGPDDPGYDSSGPRLTGIAQPHHRPRVDPGVCSGGFVVPQPEANPGLVGDCEALLRVQETLAGTRPLFWDGKTPIDQWAGVGLAFHEWSPTSLYFWGAPPRVRALNLEGLSFNGTLPAELGQLTALQSLVIRGWQSDRVWGHYLTGTIPPELGQLGNLLQLSLYGHHLVGHLPVEFGQLRSLATLQLNDNNLSGPIPPEWASIGSESPLLPSRPQIFLSNNQLTGGVPAELEDRAMVRMDQE